jgi:integrase/recombinase XerD
MFQTLIQHFPPEKLEDPRTLTDQDFQEWAIALRERLATATFDQRLAKAKAFFNWCGREGFLKANPAGKIKRPKNNWQPDPLSEDEIAMLLQESKHGRAGIRNYAILCMFLDSGIRNSELCRLRVEDVSIKTGSIKIREGKGDKDRTVLIGRKAKDALWRWLMQRPEEATYLFCTEQGGEIDRTRMCVIMRRIGQRVGIRVYPHRLRHTFALQYIKKGGDPYTLQYLLGHEDMTVTRMYVKMAAQDVTGTYRSLLDGL